MPPETPASTKWILCLRASAYRRCESWKFELPPSTIVSPGSSRRSSSWNAFSVISPAGIISQNARGALELVAELGERSSRSTATSGRTS